MDHALRGEEIGRAHFFLTARVLSERQALRYSSVIRSGLDAAFSISMNDVDSGEQSVRRAWNVLVRSRALVLDEMAGRHRTMVWADEARVVRLHEPIAFTESAFDSDGAMAQLSSRSRSILND